MKTTILVVGLLPGQKNRVQKKCEAMARLKFVEAKHNCAISGRADHCIIMQKFVDHGHSAKAFNQFPRNRVHFARGGVDEVMRTILLISDL